MKYEVLLTAGTVGTVLSDAEVTEGQPVTVTLRDENGRAITAAGVVTEILDACEDWE